MAGIVFLGLLFVDLLSRKKTALQREDRFATRAALLALTGFLLAGFFEYSYGHSLALILLSFAVLQDLQPDFPQGG
jgi:hypothetical protein